MLQLIFTSSHLLEQKKGLESIFAKSESSTLYSYLFHFQKIIYGL